jgi:hypothetical protein
VEIDMNLDQRQTALIHDPMGKWLPTSPGGGKPNELQGLKGTSPLGETQVARGEKFADGKPPGLSRLMELSAECDAASKSTSWRDNLVVPEPPSHNVRNMAMGISGGAVAGVLACVLAMNYIRNAKAEHSPPPVFPVHEVSQAANAANATDVNAPETAAKKSAEEKHADSGPVLTPEARGELPSKSTPDPRLKSRLDPAVLFRLELSLDQAAHIRTILDRCAKDHPFAEEQIRGLLTDEQNRQWESIAP